ncbi:MAG: polyamine ABC transporter ATP-binding protein [Alphaproteobacteria bacterium]|nr:polyamine ABC transporter ATP-binding protein [Alphaproteobacteria bacterium]
MSEQAYIDIVGVTKRFAGGVKAVDNANLGIKRGEFFSLLGPSGCGKTTLLRMIAGFEFPSEGEIRIDGQNVEGVAANYRPTNMVFQSYAIFPHLNVRDNVAYGLRKDRLSRSELNKRVDEALNMVKLQGFGARQSSQLSGGQRQRVALARALIKRPKVLLLDEPLSALDKKLREEMQFELRQLQQNVGITFVFVTHDQEEALSLSDRVAVMFSGKILQVAGARQLYESPSSRAVADFIGSINFFPGVVKGIEGQEIVVEAEGLGLLRAPIAAGTGGASFKPGSAILVAIRPEKLSLSVEPPPGNAITVKGTVLTSAYLGDRSHYHVRIPGREAPVAVSGTQSARSLDVLHAHGTDIYLSVSGSSVILLPPD